MGSLGDLDDILMRLESLLGPRNGDPVPLEGGITNRNFLVTLGGSRYVVRVNGAQTQLLGIDRSSERIAAEAAAQLGVGARVLAVFDEGMACEYIPAAALSAGELEPHVELAARALRAFHDSHTALPSSFGVPGLLSSYAAVIRSRGATPPEGFDPLVELAAKIASALGDAALRPCHNDLLPANLLLAGDPPRLLIVDWDYAAMGDPRFDLGNLSVNNDLSEHADELLLVGYHGRPPEDARRAELKLMRVMSDIREAAWGAAQSAISELDFDFESYGARHHERLRAAIEGPGFEEWIASARG